MIGRIATFSQSMHLLDSSLRTQAQLADVQAQTASGVKSSTYGGYGLSAGGLARQQSAQALAEAEAANAARAGDVAEQAYAALGSISDLLETVLSSLAADGSGSPGLTSLADGWLDDLESLLNTRHGDQSLFAGSAVSATPVDLDAWSAAEPGTYYSGSATPLSYVGSDGVVIALSVSANNAALSGLIDTLKGLAAGATTSSEALDAVKIAASAIGDIRTQISSNASRLARVAEAATARADALSAVVSTLKDADLSTAAVLATQYETQLQTAYSTLNMLMSVKLSDYLR